MSQAERDLTVIHWRKAAARLREIACQGPRDSVALVLGAEALERAATGLAGIWTCAHCGTDQVSRYCMTQDCGGERNPEGAGS